MLSWTEYNYLEKYPKYQTESKCKAESSTNVRLILAIPFRPEDIDKSKID